MAVLITVIIVPGERARLGPIKFRTELTLLRAPAFGKSVFLRYRAND